MGKLGMTLIRSLHEMSGKSIWELYKGKPLKFKLEMYFYTTPIFTPIHKVMQFYRIQVERINRLWAYGKHIWTTGEFDHSWHLELQLVSLKRLYRIMKTGHHLWSKTADRKMLTCINLLQRMTTPWESYHEPADNAFQKKWGFADTYSLFTHPTEKSRFYTSRHAFRDSLPPDKQKEFDREYSVVLHIEDKMYKQDCELFCKLWQKHHQKWWD